MLIVDIVGQLKRDEGLKLQPYKDTLGILSIGYGRNLDADGISVLEAEMLLEHDIAEATLQVCKVLPWANNLDLARQGALINLTFNLGIAKLLTFKKMLAALQSKNYELASKELLDSTYAKQVGARAQRLALQIELGVWQ